MLSFALFENIQRAKKFLSNKNVEDISDFEKISDLLSKNPNYIYQFTKFRYQENIPMDDIEKVIDVIRNNKNVIKLLKKNLIDYVKFEELIDDITDANYKAIVNKFLTEAIWYKSFRKKLKDYLSEMPQKSNVIIEFLKIENDLQKEFLATLKYYKMNNVSADSFLDEMENFVEKKSLRSEDVIKKIKAKGDKLNIVYNKDNVIIITTRDRDVVKEFGSQKWCIVYSDNYFGSYIGSKANQQYICLNLNLPNSNYNSLFGVTVDPNGNISYGARQDLNNTGRDMEYIVKSLGVGGEIFKPLSDSELAELEPQALINSNIISKLTEEQIKKLNIQTKLKYKLLKDDEIMNLDPDDKVLNGYISYLTEEDKEHLDDDLIEKYEIVLSEEQIKSRDSGYKMRTGNFKYLNSEEIDDINDWFSKKFKDYNEVKKWYKELNLIDKLNIMLPGGWRGVDWDLFNTFFSKVDLYPLEEHFGDTLLNDSIDHMLNGESISIFDDSIDYWNSNLDSALNLNIDYIHNAISGYYIELDLDEINYINYYINESNFNLIKEKFNLTKIELEDIVGSAFFVNDYLQDDYNLLNELSYDMERFGNEASEKFRSLCPIKFSRRNIEIDLNDLLVYLEENDKHEYKTLHDWTSSDVLFISDDVDYYTLDEWQPSPSAENATNFNDSLEKLLDDYDGDTNILKELINLGFSKKEAKYNEGLVLIKNSDNEDLPTIRLEVSFISEDGKIKFRKKVMDGDYSEYRSGDLDYLKKSLTQLDLF